MKDSFSYGRLSDKETLISIKKYLRNLNNYRPHTAVGYSIGQTVLETEKEYT